MSMVDMVTDVQVIVEYLNTPGKEAYAYPLMGMVGTCLFFQLITVFMQNRKAPKAKMAKEVLIVLSGLKPGFDAYRVAKGADQIVGAVLDPASEHVGTKMHEMVCESIPGECLFQLMLDCQCTALTRHVDSRARLHPAVLRALEDAEGDRWCKLEFHHQPADLGSVDRVQLRHHHVGLRHGEPAQAR